MIAICYDVRYGNQCITYPLIFPDLNQSGTNNKYSMCCRPMLIVAFMKYFNERKDVLFVRLLLVALTRYMGTYVNVVLRKLSRRVNDLP